VIIIRLENCKIPACMEAGTTTHRWEFERPTIRELMRIQEALGLDPDQWQTALNDAAEKFTTTSGMATLMLVNILHRRIGIVCTLEDTDLDIYDLTFEADPEAEAEQEGKDETPTSPLPEDGGPASSTSGPCSEEESEPKSSTTPETSGGASASP
jgi:hypothetical protein